MKSERDVERSDLAFWVGAFNALLFSAPVWTVVACIGWWVRDEILAAFR